MRAAIRTILLGGLDPNALAWSKTVTVSSTRLRLVSSTIKNLKAVGAWQIYDRWHFLAAENYMQARTCWKSLAVASPINGPTFTANRGFAGDGLSSYLDTTCNPTAAGSQYTQASASMGIYTRTNRTSAQASANLGLEASGASRSYLNQWYTGDVLFWTVNEGIDLTVAHPTTVAGMWILAHGPVSGLYQNGSLLSAAVGTPAAPANNTFLIGAQRNVGTPSNFSTDQNAGAIFGAAPPAALVMPITTIINAHMAAIGAAVF